MDKYLDLTDKIECPLCSNRENFTRLKEACSYDAAAHYFVGKEIEDKRFDVLLREVERLWGGEKAHLYKCNSCDLLFSNPFIGGSENFYKAAYNTDLDYPIWKWDFEVAFNYVQGNLKDKKILEIGSGIGNFLKKIVLFCCPGNIISTEFSEIGISSIKSLGVKCYNKNITDDCFLSYKESFDYIFCFQTLEHIANLDNFFERIQYLLKKDGKFIVTVPNGIQRYFILKHEVILDMPPTHLTTWFKKNFEIIETNWNLELLEHKYEIGSKRNTFIKVVDLLFKYKHYEKNRWLRFIKKRMIYLLNIHIYFQIPKNGTGTSQLAIFRKR